MFKLKRSTWIILTIFLYNFLPAFGQSNSSASIELAENHGAWYIEHQIAKGETLYSLSKRYGISVDEIEKSNPGTSEGISISEIIFIPIADEFRKLHVVKQGETLYSIAREYNVKVQDLKKWNSLRGNSIDVGQDLQIFIFDDNEHNADVSDKSIHVVATKESLYSIAIKYNVSVNDLMEWNNLGSSNISIGQKLIVSGNQGSGLVETKPQPTSTNQEEASHPVNQNVKPAGVGTIVYPVPLESPLKKFKRREERGMAELIDGSTESVKYLALHRDAPKGTILIVRNELNNQVVFARVIGPLPDTGVNNRVIVKISKVAWEKLGAVNKRFRAKVSYFQ